MEDGVILIDPATAYIDDEVKLVEIQLSILMLLYKEIQKLEKILKYYRELEL